MPKSRLALRMLSFLLVFSLLVPSNAPAQGNLDADIEALKKEVESVRKGYEDKIGELMRQIDTLESRSRSRSESAAVEKASVSQTAQEPGSSRPAETAIAARTRAAGQSGASNPETGAAEEKPKLRTQEGTETILVEKGGVLIPKGTLVFEPSINYTHFSRNVITISGFTILEAILIGRLRVEEVKRDVLTGTMTFRYGLSDRLQFDVEIPYLYRRDRIVLPARAGEDGRLQPARLTDDHGLGDIITRLNVHAYRGVGWKPDIILNARAKLRTGRDPYGLATETVNGQTLTRELPTGTGHYGVAGGLTLVKATDPIVFFAAANYFWNISRNVGDGLGKVEPGNSIEYLLGMALALSERASLNISFQNIFTDTTTVSGFEIPDSELNAATLSIGAGYSLSRRVSLYGTVGVGLTNDSPDFQLQLSVPIYFDLL